MSGDTWSRNDVDRFVLAKLRAEELTPAALHLRFPFDAASPLAAFFVFRSPAPAHICFSMRRAASIFGLVLFSIGAVAGLLLIALHIAEGNLKPVAFVPFGTALFLWTANACRRDLQRLKQEAQFRAGKS